MKLTSQRASSTSLLSIRCRHWPLIPQPVANQYDLQGGFPDAHEVYSSILRVGLHGFPRRVVRRPATRCKSRGSPAPFAASRTPGRTAWQITHNDGAWQAILQKYDCFSITHCSTPNRRNSGFGNRVQELADLRLRGYPSAHLLQLSDGYPSNTYPAAHHSVAGFAWLGVGFETPRSLGGALSFFTRSIWTAGLSSSSADNEQNSPTIHLSALPHQHCLVGTCNIQMPPINQLTFYQERLSC